MMFLYIALLCISTLYVTNASVWLMRRKSHLPITPRIPSLVVINLCEVYFALVFRTLMVTIPNALPCWTFGVAPILIKSIVLTLCSRFWLILFQHRIIDLQLKCDFSATDSLKWLRKFRKFGRWSSIRWILLGAIMCVSGFPALIITLISSHDEASTATITVDDNIDFLDRCALYSASFITMVQVIMPFIIFPTILLLIRISRLQDSWKLTREVQGIAVLLVVFAVLPIVLALQIGDKTDIDIPVIFLNVLTILWTSLTMSRPIYMSYHTDQKKRRGTNGDGESMSTTAAFLETMDTNDSSSKRASTVVRVRPKAKKPMAQQLLKLLNHPQGLEAFRNHLRRELNIENLKV